MTLNRYTAACHPQWHQVCWNRTVVWVLLAIDVGVSYGANSPLFFTKFYYEETVDGWKYLGRKDSVLGIRLMITIVLFSYEFISVIFITMTVVTIKREMKKGGLEKGRETGLILFTVISVSMSMLEALYEISYFVDPDLKTAFFEWIVEQESHHTNEFLSRTSAKPLAIRLKNIT
ncbi:hypothetical protein ANCCAN_02340 [Ancylostoma caninum]|uniref:Serpentine receptor class gamma n=1 Tax=Ancylostoma caninum TaxID=29170 RepID=A0A368H8I7_ANCCA|nr:hypothetical protein ANCCAN_02340 [Ancylostoma caninum]